MRLDVTAPHYEPLGMIMLRSPLLPIDTVQTLFSADPEDDEILRDFLDSPVIKEAILIGSSDLYRALQQLQARPNARKAQRTRAALLRYLIRMASRPTPFGVFAGVNAGDYSSRTQVQLGPLQNHRTRTRPDMQWLLRMVRDLESRPLLAECLLYFTNSAAFVAGGRLHLPHRDTAEQEDEQRASLRFTPVVQRTLEFALHGTSLPQLRALLRHEWPQASDDQLNRVLTSLCSAGALESELRPPLSGGDPTRYLLSRLAGKPDCDDVRNLLREVCDRVHNYDCYPVGDGLGALSELHQIMEQADTRIRSPLHVDLAMDFVAADVSTSLIDEMAQAAALVVRLSTADAQPRHLQAYRHEFIERYGEGREVPVLELLDDEAGLGPPPSYQHPPRTRFSAPRPEPHYTLRDRTLLALAITATRGGQHEIMLDDDLLARLQIHHDWPSTLPQSLDLYASIAARSPEAIEEGDYLVVVAPRIGDRPAGRSFSRFADLLTADARLAWVDAIRTAVQPCPGQINAELVYLPTQDHAANVTIRPTIHDYEILVSVSPGVDRERVLPFDDLVVGVTNDRFYLRSVSQASEVVVHDSHLLNRVGAPNVCRFLSEVTADGQLPLFAFDWGAASHLPYLPRLRVGRIVVCPAEWHVPADTLLTHSDTNVQKDDLAQLRSWCREWNVPRYCYLTDADNRLLLDLDNPLCQQELLRACRRLARVHGTVTLQEMLPSFDETWAPGPAGRHAVEFVVAFQRQPAIDRSPPPTTGRRPLPMAEYRSQLGSAWLYAHIYSPASRHDDLIGGGIRQLVQEINRQQLADRWFFIRYLDPEPHIRIRFHGDPDRLITRLLPVLISWNQQQVAQGLTEKLMLDAYDREIERYGGWAGMALAEQMFAIDSWAVMQLLALKQAGQIACTMRDLTLMSLDDLVAAVDPNPLSRLSLYRSLTEHSNQPLTALRRDFHEHFRTYQLLVNDYEWRKHHLGSSYIEEVLAQRRTQLNPLGSQLQRLAANDGLISPLNTILASWMHMHCNRLLGVNRGLETEVILLLARTLDSLARRAPAVASTQHPNGLDMA